VNDKPWPPFDDEAYLRQAVEILGPARATLFAGVEAVVLDADGVLTPGNLFYGPEGEALKEFDTRDGLGLVLARGAGLKLAVLSGRQSGAVQHRAVELRFAAVKLGRFDKAAALQEIADEIGCPAAAMLYMGDDLVDLPALYLAGVAVTVPGAPAEVRDRCNYVTRAAGGRGAVREVLDLVLKCRGLYGEALRRLGERVTHPHGGGDR
jgi:3-deoxy-D-manno-octulosonate 8-phosphate phosphatase (KDO 8-P phosphatase)